ncbi:MAG: type II toxin-antitoxin system VapB family antitoxin [Acidimicrobiia bacterium]|nr:type II toxin-antitoxin system VapB family antitoxin [Acidimicrobiia bacterium]
MSRTTIDIDAELLTRVMQRYRIATKRDAVDFALRKALGEPVTRVELLGVRGTGWVGDLEAMRRDRR